MPVARAPRSKAAARLLVVAALVGCCCLADSSTSVAAAAPERSSVVEPDSPDCGTLKGRLLYDGTVPRPAQFVIAGAAAVPLRDESLLVDPESHGIANIVVFVRTKGVDVHPSYRKHAAPTMSIGGGRLDPHVAPVWIERKLTIKNADAVGCNPNIAPLGDKAVNPLLPPAAEMSVEFGRSQTVGQPITCNVHPWMKAWVLPRDNPYFAVSDAQGTFEIKNLPAGMELEFQVWHEKAGYVDTKSWPKGRFTMTINQGENDLGDVRLSPALFAK